MKSKMKKFTMADAGARKLTIRRAITILAGPLAGDEKRREIEAKLTAKKTTNTKQKGTPKCRK